MNKKLISLVMLVGVIAFGMAFVSCGGSETSKLVGVWESSDETMELLKDGSLNVEGSPAGTWVVEDGKLVATVLGFVLSYDYQLSGNTLTFTDEDGEITEYTRQ